MIWASYQGLVSVSTLSIQCHMVIYITGNFSNDTSYEWVYEYCHGWLKFGWNPCQLLPDFMDVWMVWFGWHVETFSAYEIFLV